MIEPRTDRRVRNDHVKVRCIHCGSVRRRCGSCRLCSRLRRLRPTLSRYRLARRTPAGGNDDNWNWSIR
jgi:hypothetical protein